MGKKFHVQATMVFHVDYSIAKTEEAAEAVVDTMLKQYQPDAKCVELVSKSATCVDSDGDGFDLEPWDEVGDDDEADELDYNE